MLEISLLTTDQKVTGSTPVRYANSPNDLCQTWHAPDPVCQPYVPIVCFISRVTRLLGVVRNGQEQKETRDVDAV